MRNGLDLLTGLFFWVLWSAERSDKASFIMPNYHGSLLVKGHFDYFCGPWTISAAQTAQNKEVDMQVGHRDVQLAVNELIVLS